MKMSFKIALSVALVAVLLVCVTSPASAGNPTKISTKHADIIVSVKGGESGGSEESSAEHGKESGAEHGKESSAEHGEESGAEHGKEHGEEGGGEEGGAADKLSLPPEPVAATQYVPKCGQSDPCDPEHKPVSPAQVGCPGGNCGPAAVEPSPIPAMHNDKPCTDNCEAQEVSEGKIAGPAHMTATLGDTGKAGYVTASPQALAVPSSGPVVHDVTVLPHVISAAPCNCPPPCPALVTCPAPPPCCSGSSGSPSLIHVTLSSTPTIVATAAATACGCSVCPCSVSQDPPRVHIAAPEAAPEPEPPVQHILVTSNCGCDVCPCQSTCGCHVCPCPKYQNPAELAGKREEAMKRRHQEERDEQRTRLHHEFRGHLEQANSLDSMARAMANQFKKLKETHAMLKAQISSNKHALRDLNGPPMGDITKDSLGKNEDIEDITAKSLGVPAGTDENLSKRHADQAGDLKQHHGHEKHAVCSWFKSRGGVVPDWCDEESSSSGDDEEKKKAEQRAKKRHEQLQKRIKALEQAKKIADEHKTKKAQEEKMKEEKQKKVKKLPPIFAMQIAKNAAFEKKMAKKKDEEHTKRDAEHQKHLSEKLKAVLGSEEGAVDTSNLGDKITELKAKAASAAADAGISAEESSASGAESSASS